MDDLERKVRERLAHNMDNHFYRYERLQLIIKENVLRLMEEREWNQKYLAEQIGLSEAAVSMMLSNQRGIGLRSLSKLAIAFGVTEWSLLK